jgi:hypothetical protein
VRARLLPALLAAFALLAASAPAQEQTPTPTPTVTPEPTATPEPKPERSDDVKAIFRDYRRDAEIGACDHERGDLRAALKSLTDQEDLENPDLRYLLQAGIDEHKSGDCAEQAAEEDEDDDGTATPTPTPTATPAPVTPTPTISPDSGFTPDSGGSLGGGDDDPLGSGDLSPVTPEVTPVPPADALPSTTIPPAEAATPAPAPAPVYANADDPVPVPLIVLAGLLGLVALTALLLLALNRSAWGERALAGPRRAWSEAAFRAGGTWGDFADWIRVGR